MKKIFTISFILIFISAAGFSAAQAQKDTVAPEASAAASGNSLDFNEGLVKKCMEVPVEKRLGFAMEYYAYLDYKMQDMASGIANCRAYEAGNKAECSVFNNVVSLSGLRDPEMKTGPCEKSADIFIAARKAAGPGKTCATEINNYCESNNLCGRMSDWGEIECQCPVLSGLLCEIIGAETPGQCSRITKNETLRKNLPKWYFPPMISECQAIIKGQPSKLVGKGESRLMDIIFMASLLKGNKWPLFDETTDQKSLNVAEEFIWHWKYIYYTGLPCDNKLKSAWEGFCGDLPRIYEIKRSAEETFRKENTPSGAATSPGQ